MKALILILSLILVASNNSNACNVVDNEKLNAVIEAAAEVKSLVEDDAEFAKIGDQYSPKLQRDLNQGALEPINFNETKHNLDYYTLGNVIVDTKSIDGTKNIKVEGSAIKIGKSCVLTSAHTLYASGYQEMDSKNKGKFNNSIKFQTGSGSDVKEHKASVFFQMVNKGEDFTTEQEEKTVIIDGVPVKRIIKKRVFKGHNDLVLLKLDGYSDTHFKETLIVNPKSLFANVDEEIGRKISCHGSPVHMTSQKFGSCKGSDFKWKQENARVFADDVDAQHGVYTNAVTSEGMSGGPCYLNENSDKENSNKVFGIVANGYGADSEGNLKMPRLKFDKNNYRSGNVRYIGLLHILDQRLKSELGYGLDKISENCK